MRSTRLDTRQRIWAYIRVFPGEFRLRELRNCFRAKDRPPLDTVRTYVRCLVAGGYLAVRRERPTEVWYRLQRDTGAEAPRLRPDGSPVPEGARDLIWRTVFILRDFTIPELCFAASTETVTVTKEAAMEYCRALTRAGYLRRTRDRRVRYRALAIRRTGPAAPMLLGHRLRVYDPNLDRVVWPGEIDHE